ncbi:MAG TPA: hypothetical protein DEB40_01085 [Elusimicrobia bacterium]|nr:hypothetical protein [Elusimicrobiota bacterium]HBT60324.1 hypothetical protein [Elusimicrobiota bacterium]
MFKLALTSLFLLCPISARASLPQGWSDIIAKLQEYGTFRPEDKIERARIPATIAIKDIIGSENAPHHADYLNVWGSQTGEGPFRPEYFTMISEDWRIVNGQWHVEQWYFTISTDGQLIKVNKGTVISALDGQHPKSTWAAVSPADPAANARFNKIFAKWRAFKPK